MYYGWPRASVGYISLVELTFLWFIKYINEVFDCIHNDCDKKLFILRRNDESVLFLTHCRMAPFRNWFWQHEGIRRNVFKKNIIINLIYCTGVAVFISNVLVYCRQCVRAIEAPHYSEFLCVCGF